MTTLIQAKQINKYLLAPLAIAGFTTSAANNDTALITAAIATALATGSNSGGTLPNVVGSNSAEGFPVTSPLNYVPVFASGPSKQRLADSLGNEVYAKLTGAAGAWVLSYFSAPAGVETVYTFAAATVIDVELPYWFTFDDLPAASLLAVQERHVSPDVLSGVPLIQTDVLTPTAVDTLPALSQTPAGSMLQLIVNGQVFPAVSLYGSLAAKQLTWVAATAGFHLATTDSVIAVYTY